jgi:hypothetical protein
MAAPDAFCAKAKKEGYDGHRDLVACLIIKRMNCLLL